MNVLIGKELCIPETELLFTMSRSGGPGGQHVNKVSSRVTLHFNVKKTKTLNPHQKKRVLAFLHTRVNRAGVLQLHSQKYRSQSANRDDLLERFTGLLEMALKPRTPRVPTKMSKGSKEKRLKEKKRHGQLKQTRSRQHIEE